jgi:N-acetylglutamate synthase
MTTVAHLDRLMTQTWPATSVSTVDGWLARSSHGVDLRTSSVLPIAAPPDLHAALDRVESLYRTEGLPAAFQITPAAQPSGLDDELDGRGYAVRWPILVLTTGVGDGLRRLREAATRVLVTDEPDEEWMDLWWSVEGQGSGQDVRATVWRIVTGTPARYAQVRDAGGVAAVGRLATADDWAGIYCMAVRPDARRRGHGAAILHALLEQADRVGARQSWLQAVADNHAAQRLYAAAGYSLAYRYHYRVRAVQTAGGSSG